MAFNYEPLHDPIVPTVEGHRANEWATAAADARQSRETLERQIRRAQGNPVNRKFRATVESSQIYFYLLMVLVFVCTLAGEWAVSGAIYEVLTPGQAWILFLLCVGVGLVISACLAESSSHFAWLNLADEAVAEHEGAVRDSLKEVYGERKTWKTATAWVFQPTTGTVLGILFLYGVYRASQYRVDLLHAAGQDKVGAFHVYLPVILYGVEIYSGMSTVFSLFCLLYVWQARRSQTTLAKAKRSEDTLRQAAIQAYTSYLHGYNAYSAGAVQQRRPEPILVPANGHLRRILTEGGYDLLQSGASQPDSPPTQDPSTPVDAYERAPAGGDGAPPQPERGPEQPPHPEPHDMGIMSDPPGHSVTPNDSTREADLLGLLDAQIAAQNRGF